MFQALRCGTKDVVSDVLQFTLRTIADSAGQEEGTRGLTRKNLRRSYPVPKIIALQTEASNFKKSSLSLRHVVHGAVHRTTYNRGPSSYRKFKHCLRSWRNVEGDGKCMHFRGRCRSVRRNESRNERKSSRCAKKREKLT